MLFTYVFFCVCVCVVVLFCKITLQYEDFEFVLFVLACMCITFYIFSTFTGDSHQDFCRNSGFSGFKFFRLKPKVTWIVNVCYCGYVISYQKYACCFCLILKTCKYNEQFQIRLSYQYTFRGQSCIIDNTSRVNTMRILRDILVLKGIS